MKTLCLYYSRTNLTKEIMKKIAAMTDARLLEYTDGVYRQGVSGYIRSCFDAFRKPPEVFFFGNEPEWEEYDKVIVAMPVWAEQPCVIGKALLMQYSGKFRGDVYLVVTHMANNDYDKAIRKIYPYCAKEPVAHLSLQTKKHDPTAEIEQFVRDHGLSKAE
ncbi:MAG: hypothetical protein IJH77_00980 [Mogibacterium sp.]|nr:hypothetical protein [Mogibacterium sp.]